jgi:hypothetical protein
MDLNTRGKSVGGVMSFYAVVTVPGLACSLVDTDQADMSGFEEPVEMNTSQGPVVGVSFQARQLCCSFEILVDDQMTLGHTLTKGVDRKDHLLVPVQTTYVCEGPGKAGDHGPSPCGMTARIWVVTVIPHLTGGLVDLAGVALHVAGPGGHYRHIPVGDPLHGRMT